MSPTQKNFGTGEELDPGRHNELLHRIFDFPEKAAREGDDGDDEVVAVIRDALWGLATYADVDRYKSLIGRKSRALLRQTN